MKTVAAILTLIIVCSICITQAELCPEEFTAIGDYCYYFSTTSLDWEAARQHCDDLIADRGADLAVFDLTCGDYRKLTAHMDIEGYTQGYWIGGTDQGHNNFWTWIDSRPMDLGSNTWKADEPLNSSQWNCALMQRSMEGYARYELMDNSCTEVLKFVCQLDVHAKATSEVN